MQNKDTRCDVRMEVGLGGKCVSWDWVLPSRELQVGWTVRSNGYRDVMDNAIFCGQRNLLRAQLEIHSESRPAGR